MTNTCRKAYHAKYYQDHKLKQLEQSRNNYYNNHDYWIEKGRKYIRTDVGRFNRIKTLASKRHVAMTITLSQYRRIIKSNTCYYCNGPLPDAGSGLDRIDSLKGYTKNNVRPCCTVCNLGKRIQTESEFRNWIIKVYKNWARRK